MTISKKIPVTLAMILKARKRLAGIVLRTPLEPSDSLSTIGRCSAFIKWESLQRTGVFKLRGAYNKVASLPSDIAKRGVITASTGNHGLAVAYAAKQRRIPATIVVPEGSSPLKVRKCKQYGAQILVHGSNYDEAADHSLKIAERTRAVLVHAYADPQVIAGQGTLGLEVLEDLPEADVLLVPVGGGGLISGVSIWAKTANPNIRIIGIQTTATRAFYENFKAKRLFHVPVEPTIADGLAGNTEQMNLSIALHYVDEIILVEETGLREAIRWTLENERRILEPAAVVGIAALLQQKVVFKKDETVALLATGSNIDPTLLQSIFEAK